MVVAALLILRDRETIAEQLRVMSLPLVVGAVVLTVTAKLLLGENARLAAVRNEVGIGYETALRLYNLSQLGKYLPGSVWQYVGRAAAYRSLGAGYGRIRDALLTESLWVVGGAAAVGVVLSGAAVLPVVAQSLGPRAVTWLAAGVAALLLAVLVGLLVRRATVLRLLRRAVPTPRAVLVQAGVWAGLGASFWCLTRAAGMAVPVSYATGLFALAYAVGFLVLFVPAGLGVRDGILVLGLLPYASTEEAVVVVLMARLVYVGVELLLVLAQEVLPRLGPEEAHLTDEVR